MIHLSYGSFYIYFQWSLEHGKHALEHPNHQWNDMISTSVVNKPSLSKNLLTLRKQKLPCESKADLKKSKGEDGLNTCENSLLFLELFWP